VRLAPSIIVFLAAILGGQCAPAANLTSFTTKEKKEVIKLDGEITEGDTAHFVELVHAANQAGRIVSGIRLNSVGGNLLEGAKLADAIRFAKIASVVTKESTCASACFLAFAAGTEKFAAYSAKVGVHGASEPNGNETTGSEAATVAMARAVKELGVPAAIIGKMVVTPPSEMVWLSPDDLQSMGTVLVGKPDQALGQPTDITPPSQVAPAIPDQKSQAALAPSWTDLTNEGINISARQNNGRADFRRTCQADIKICTNGLWFKNDKGVQMLLRVAQDPDGKMISRDICSFNEFMDIRTCTDYDTHVTTKEMLDGNKVWKTIE
jgi:hypothetical protein